jgi:hypothetical protein
MRLSYVVATPVPILAVAALLLGSACSIRAAGLSAEREVIAAQKSLITANNAADVAAVDQLTADEWIGVDTSGVSRTKAQLREAIVKRGPAIVQATPEQLSQRQKEWRVRVYSDVGVLTRLTAGDHGSRSWITTVWVRRDGRWQQVLTQGTTASQP